MVILYIFLLFTFNYNQGEAFLNFAFISPILLKKIPELMRGLGKGVKSFKQGLNEVEEEIKEIKKDVESEAEKTE